MAKLAFHMPKEIIDKSIEVLKHKSNQFIKEELLAPNKKRMRNWLREKIPEKYWPGIRDLVSKFRRSLPIVSHRIPDGKKSTKGKKLLGRTFSSPSWVSADLGD